VVRGRPCGLELAVENFTIMSHNEDVVLCYDLVQENRERELLEREVLDLREENARLHEESQLAASQLRRFSGWFFNAIDKR